MPMREKVKIKDPEKAANGGRPQYRGMTKAK